MSSTDRRRIFYVPEREPDIRAPLKICVRRFFASGQSPTGKIIGGYLQAATFKSSCSGLFAHTLKIHPIELLGIPSNRNRAGTPQAPPRICFRWIIVKAVLSPSIRCPFHVFFSKKRPFGLKTRAGKHILYCRKSAQCHCEQEKKQKLRQKNKTIARIATRPVAAGTSGRPQLRTRLNPQHSAGAIGNSK